ncbi:hypothetical protein [Parasphingorhabdus cellanae]|uniref:Uncharacterized protein n=1 Tax=Parasphingorhabdus cellanae TaxID=2806553 RepID=A0ABX7T4F0_9SPHN|nr:hypothetical protein [Parasphingorhabdus cellanae]QTD54853.1 hypothetical protein J4G78_11395 [Parasphingorhabdus cellanae]
MNPDSCPVGEIPEAPYFFGASLLPMPETDDPFDTAGWISHCEAYASIFLKR